MSNEPLDRASSTLSSAGPRIVVALDVDDYDRCMALAKELDPKLCRLKVGKELFTACGPRIVEGIQNLGFDVFLDLKFHDIPVTVAKAVKSAANLGVWMVNVHASGGTRMLEAAREAVDSSSHKPLLIGVTVLTSMSEEDLHEVGVNKQPAEQVLHLASMVNQAGLDGVVCSAREAKALKEHTREDFVLVTPGIRPAGSASNDQRRIMTPAEAMAAGSDYLVIGRPISQADNPKLVCQEIVAEIS